MTSPVVGEELKAECIDLEHVGTNMDKENSFSEPDYTPDELKKVLRKLDFHLPLCFLLYTFSVLDVRFPPG